jgi:hypothetical protein
LPSFFLSLSVSLPLAYSHGFFSPFLRDSGEIALHKEGRKEDRQKRKNGRKEDRMNRRKEGRGCYEGRKEGRKGMLRRKKGGQTEKDNLKKGR